jgi:hypothetical protein
MIIEIELTDEQRRKLSPLLEQHSRDDFEGAIIGQASNTGQGMAFTYLAPGVARGLTVFLDQEINKVKGSRPA